MPVHHGRREWLPLPTNRRFQNEQSILDRQLGPHYRRFVGDIARRRENRRLRGGWAYIADHVQGKLCGGVVLVRRDAGVLGVSSRGRAELYEGRNFQFAVSASERSLILAAFGTAE